MNILIMQKLIKYILYKLRHAITSILYNKKFYFYIKHISFKSKFAKNAGFSLIEVLVALTIVSISMGAFLYSSQENIRSQIIIKDKILAQNNVWNQLINPEKKLDSDYDINIKKQATSIKKIKKITITASSNRKITSLTRFIYEK